MTSYKHGLFEEVNYGHRWIENIMFHWHLWRKTKGRIFSPTLITNSVNSWMTFDLTNFTNSKRHQFNYAMAHEQLSQLTQESLDEFNSKYPWLLLRHRTPAETLDFLSRIEYSDADGPDKIKNILTVSGLLYGCQVPDSWVKYDTATYISYLIAFILSQSVSIDMTKCEPAAYLSIEEPRKVIRECFQCGMVDFLCNRNKPANFEAAKAELRHIVSKANIGSLPYLKKILFSPEANDRIKKIFTIIFLTTIKTVPNDYLYIDIEVMDMVNRTGDFEIDNKAGTILKPA